MTGEPPNVIYPQYCFHLSPTIEKWCRFTAREIHGLASHKGFQGQDLYFHLNHPIKWVQVAGVVVAIDEFYGKRSYTIDDSSGATIECLLSVPKQNANLAAISETAAERPPHGQDKLGTKAKAASTENPARQEEVKAVIDGDIDVGDVLLVKGNITVFRKNKQIRVYKISHMRCTEDEVQFWKKMTEFHNDVLSKPWLLSDKELRRCREVATRPGDTEPRENRRRKRKAGESLRTGLEKTTVQKDKPARTTVDMKGSSKLRVTGLERAGTYVESISIGLESGSVPKKKARSTTSVSDAGITTKPKTTGLERTTKRAESVLCTSNSIPATAKTTPATEKLRPSKSRVTGLERGIMHQEFDSSRVNSGSRTATESLSTGRKRSRKAKLTGLERGTTQAQRSGTDSASTSETERLMPARPRKVKATGLERTSKHPRACPD